jgi:hypothetical protein
MLAADDKAAVWLCETVVVVLGIDRGASWLEEAWL